MQNEQLEGDVPRKRVKTETQEMQPEDSWDAVYEQSQLADITQQLLKFADYFKNATVHIHHHERSIATLPPAITDKYPHLRTRGRDLRQMAHHNAEFFTKVTLPYKSLIKDELRRKKQEEQQQPSQEHSHSHSHSHSHAQSAFDNNSALTVFRYSVEEWSEQKPSYVNRVVNLMQTYWAPTNGGKVLVVGCRMGRMQYQIQQKWKELGLTVQGHEERAEQHIFGRYFLQGCQEQTTIYPFIHDFNNYLEDSDPNRPLTLPFALQTSYVFYPLTLGQFVLLYRSHHQEWDLVVTLFQNEQVSDLLMYIRVLYSLLRPGGLWIDCSTSAFEQLPGCLSYREYQALLDRSQFKKVGGGSQKEWWFSDAKCIMNEQRLSRYRVMRK